MSSYKYSGLEFGAKKDEISKNFLAMHKSGEAPYPRVDITYAGNGVIPGAGVAVGAGTGAAAGAAPGGNDTFSTENGGGDAPVAGTTYAENGVIPDVGAAVGGGTPDETPPKTQNGGGDAVQPVDSYATFASYYEKMRQNSISSANATKENTYRSAEQARERAMVDAQNSYRKNLSGYGARAEALAGAGLTGSGYADYLDSKAYAAMRGEVQAARAQEFAAKQNANYIADQAKLAADNSYAANMLGLEEKKEEDRKTAFSNYQTLLGNAHGGVYATIDAARDAAAAAGLDEAQTTAVLDATQKHIDRLQYSHNEEVSAALGDDIGVIQNKVLGGKLSEEQGQSKIYNILSEKLEAAIVNGAEFDASEVEALTDEAWKDKFKKLYNERYETSEKAFLKSEDGYTFSEEYVTQAEAESRLAEAKKDPLLSEESKQKLQAAFDYRYGAQKADVIRRSPDIDYRPDGSRVAINYDEYRTKDGTMFKAEVGSKPCNDWVQGIAGKLGAKDGEVFVYGQHAYLMRGNKAYPLSPDKKDKESYNKLVAYIKKANGLTGG